MLKHIRINPENAQYALDIETEVLPNFNAALNYSDAVNGESDFNYFLLYDAEYGDKCVGVSGLYNVGADPENVWMGWFGILPSERRKGYGSEALRLLEETARDKGYRYMRVLVNLDVMGEETVKFFRANGYTSETYVNKNDQASLKGKYLVLSHSFYQEKVLSWNNKNLHLTDSINREKQFMS